MIHTVEECQSSRCPQPPLKFKFLNFASQILHSRRCLFTILISSGCFVISWGKGTDWYGEGGTIDYGKQGECPLYAERGDRMTQPPVEKKNWIQGGVSGSVWEICVGGESHKKINYFYYGEIFHSGGKTPRGKEKYRRGRGWTTCNGLKPSWM